MPPCAVVVPTFNEAVSIRSVLHQLKRLYPTFPIIVVDDSSPDGTADTVRSFAALCPDVTLLVREKREGFAKALQNGFEFALMQTAADWVISMDADLSHDPNDVRRLLEEAKTVELVVGSRYVKGGVSLGMRLGRRFISRLGNLYIRFLSGIPIHDVTSGFVAYRRGLLKALISRPLATRGFGCQIELKYRAAVLGARIKEVPIVFSKRRFGHSKFSAKIIIEGLLTPWRLRLFEHTFYP